MDAGSDGGTSFDASGLDPQFSTFCDSFRSLFVQRLQCCSGYTPEQAKALMNI